MIEKIYIFISNLILSYLTFLKILFRSKLFVKKLKTEGDSCYIICNGPSIKDLLENNLKNLKAKPIMCVNAFSNTEYFKMLKPKYYVFAGPEIWADDTLNDANTEKRKRMVNALIDGVNWPMVLFLPYRSKKKKDFTQKLKSNKNIDIQYFNNTPVEGNQKISFLYYDRALGMPRPHNVLIPSIMMAIYHDFKKLYLFGVDHSWLPLITVNDENVPLVNQKHFYDHSTSISKPMFIFGKKQRMLYQILEKFYHTFKSYVYIRAYANSKNVSIYNCTPKSYIDAFERRSPQEAFSITDK